jgi:hypothetical protein
LSDGDCEPEVEACDGFFSGDCWNVASESIWGIRTGSGSSVQAATVTYLKPAVGTEPEGFFVQAEMYAAGLFVAVAPGTLTPPPTVGDRVSFQATSTTIVDGMHEVTALSNWQISSSGHPVAQLAVDIGADATTPAHATYLDGSLVSLSGRLDAFTSIGGGYVAAQVQTAAWGPLPTIQLRFPAYLQVALGLAADCRVTLAPTPIWVANATAYPSAYVAGDFAVVTCPAPTSPTSNEKEEGT